MRPNAGCAAERRRGCKPERMTRPPTEAASWNKRTVSCVGPPMDGTGVSGSSSGQAVGFDPGGLSHFGRANPATVKFRGRQMRRPIPTFPILDSRPSSEGCAEICDGGTGDRESPGAGSSSAITGALRRSLSFGRVGGRGRVPHSLVPFLDARCFRSDSSGTPSCGAKISALRVHSMPAALANLEVEGIMHMRRREFITPLVSAAETIVARRRACAPKQSRTL
jgi:hypothetical protein